MNLIKYFLAIFVFSLSLGITVPVLAADSTLEGLDAAAGKIGAYSGQVGSSPDARTTVINKVGGVVGIVLSFVGIIFLVLTIYAGIMWMTAQGDTGQVTKSKDLLINALIGLIIITAAYSITTFVGNAFIK